MGFQFLLFSGFGTILGAKSWEIKKSKKINNEGHGTGARVVRDRDGGIRQRRREAAGLRRGEWRDVGLVQPG